MLLLALSVRADAGEVVNAIAEVGPHYRLVRIEKSVHPQNVLVAYTRLDERCRAVRDPKDGGRPVFDFYWLMDGARYKPVHALIARGIRQRFPVVDPAATTDAHEGFAVLLSELNEVDNDLGASPLLRIYTQKTAAGCRAEARIALGPSDRGAVLRLDVIETVAALTGRLGTKIHSIALKGTDLETGREIVRVYRAKE